MPKPWERRQVDQELLPQVLALLGQTKITGYKSNRWQFAMITIDVDELKKAFSNCIFGMKLSVLSQCDLEDGRMLETVMKNINPKLRE